ncbi:MAG: hypothetical protein OIF57_01060 [Marinobacterium sp.]|nr:hypothetical protein [Marinobacterium sp.]
MSGLIRSTVMYRLVITVLLLLLVLLAVQISWLLLARFQPASTMMPEIVSETVAVQPQFAGLSLFAQPVVAVRKPVQPVGTPETRLPLQVQGLFLAAQPQLNQVAMAVQGKPGVYLAGDRLPLSGQVLVLAVAPDQILLRHNGRKEKLTLTGSMLQQPAPLQPRSLQDLHPPQQRTVSGKASDAKVSDAKASDMGGRSLYLAQSDFARAVPDYHQRIQQDPLFLSRYLRLSPRRQHGRQGYLLQPGRDNTLYKTLQLQSDDLLVSLNQQPVSEPGKVLALLPQLGQASQLTLGLLRAGQPVTYTLYL